MDKAFPITGSPKLASYGLLLRHVLESLVELNGIELEP
jgi:hypothetical protein